MDVRSLCKRSFFHSRNSRRLGSAPLGQAQTVPAGVLPLKSGREGFPIALTKIDLAIIPGVAVDVVGNFWIDGGELELAVMHFRRERLDIYPARQAIGSPQLLLRLVREHEIQQEFPRVGV